MKKFAKSKATDLTRITWCLDIFSEPEVNEPMIQLLEHLQKEQGVEVTPTYLLSPERLKIKREFSPAWVKQTRELALNRWKNTWAAPLAKRGFTAELHLVVEPKASLEYSALKLVSTAKKQRSGILALTTHATNAFKRLFVGSLTEKLLQVSSLPLLVAHSETRAPQSLKSFVFATDLEPHSRRTFLNLQQMARQFHSEIHLVHKPPALGGPWLQTEAVMLSGLDGNLTEYLEEQEKEFVKKAEKWSSQSRAAGLECQAELLPAQKEISEAIVEYTRPLQNAILVLSNRMGWMADWLLGSVSRALIRKSPIPVLVFPKRYRA